MPDTLNLATAIKNARAQQTLNTPALATLFLMAEQLDWLLENGGIDFAVSRTRASSEHLYSWAEQSGWATPFVGDPSHRSPVVGTIDFDDRVDAARVCAVMRSNGIVDIEPTGDATRSGWACSRPSTPTTWQHSPAAWTGSPSGSPPEQHDQSGQHRDAHRRRYGDGGAGLADHGRICLPLLAFVRLGLLLGRDRLGRRTVRLELLR